MKQEHMRLIWVAVSILALGAIVTFCRAQDEAASPQVSRPDLKVYSVTAPSSASRGTLISVSDVTTNIGNAPAVQSASDIYICTNVNHVTSSSKVSSHAVSPLAAGRSWPWSGSVTVPAAQPLGTNYYIVVADGDQRVVESNYNNNTNYVMIIINQ